MKFLEEIKKRIRLSEEEETEIKKRIKEFIKKIKKPKKVKIFVGGSFAKNTMVKKEILDIDLFFIFPKSRKNISLELEKILKTSKIKAKKLKGSRDYFRVALSKKIFLEIVPIIKIKKVEEAENVTDVSPFHVEYVLKKIKERPQLADEIRLAKVFCQACNCYGAESYIRGFSGYSIEVLICHYGSFLKFVRAASSWKKQVILDPEKNYKNKKEILEKINYAKLLSPVILIDPVQPSRNLTASLSNETFEEFVKNCKAFLASPSEKFFLKKEEKIEDWKKEAKNKKAKFFLLEIFPLSDKVDIAGAKSKKFFDFLCKQASFLGFEIIKKRFIFDEKKLKSEFFFIVKEPKKILIVRGPPISAQKIFVESFKKKWKKVFIKDNRFYAKTKRKVVTFDQFLKKIKEKMKEMGIKNIKIKSNSN